MSGASGAPGAPEAPGDRYLWLLRHGKAASSARGGSGDRVRPLTPRGQRDATAFGLRLAAGQGAMGLDEVPVPEMVLCSDAMRTFETAELVVEAMGGSLSIEALASLYGAVPSTVMTYVREIDEGVSSALVVGHNPTMYELAWEMLGEDLDGHGQEAGDCGVLREHGFSTCSVAVLALHVPSWEETAGGCGSLAGVFSPPY
jgi:phosphohistidine phosphatase